jgi:hypothetical protein
VDLQEIKRGSIFRKYFDLLGNIFRIFRPKMFLFETLKNSKKI